MYVRDACMYLKPVNDRKYIVRACVRVETVDGCSQMWIGCPCFQVLRSLTEGVLRVSLTTGPGIKGVSAIAVFSSHHNASMAKKVLAEGS